MSATTLPKAIESLAGTSMIGFSRSQAGGAEFHAVNPATGEEIPPSFWSACEEDVQHAAVLAAAAAPELERMPGKRRAELLRGIAANIESLGQTLTSRVVDETGLPAARAQAETGRTCGQLRMFARLAEEGSWVDARIDRADPDRKPLPKPDIRSMLRPIGPVAVFGASNFPLAFSVAGGDTASALAAGNPVIVKAHPAHPGTSELVGQAILDAVRAGQFPDGTFSLLFDSGHRIGLALVSRTEIKAAGFTGSRSGGKALMDAIARRPDPIPFYGEMSSVNPVFFLPGALASNIEDRVVGLFASLTNGSGQFCTKPGLVFVKLDQVEPFAARLREIMSANPAFLLLTSGIRNAYCSAVTERPKHDYVTALLAASGSSQREFRVAPGLFQTDVQTLLSNPEFADEIFGPAAMLVTYSTFEELIQVAQSLEGQLTATIHGTPEELAGGQEFVQILARRSGRLIFNGFPTGVEVGNAMIHGGPWPATSDSRSTSVGTRAVFRFARPVCYQDFPHNSLPDELQDANPLGILRMVDGEFTRHN